MVGTLQRVLLGADIDKATALERLGRLEEALATFNAALMLDEADAEIENQRQ